MGETRPHGLSHAGILPARIARRIEPEPNSGCWLWTGHVERTGYGRVWWNRHQGMAHRVVYQILNGPIPEATLDHRCRVRSCVNPAHLRPATQRENIFAAGSLSITKVAAEKMHCVRGHALTEENIRRIVRDGSEHRDCRECRKQRDRLMKAAKRKRERCLNCL